MSTSARSALKAQCIKRLSEEAIEHPAGHQGKLAARYVFRSGTGEGIELMFEKGPASPANLWMMLKFAKPLMTSGIPHRLSPGHALNAVSNAYGAKIYGRHAALRPMRQLGDADLVCFRLRSYDDLEVVIGSLRLR